MKPSEIPTGGLVLIRWGQRGRGAITCNGEQVDYVSDVKLHWPAGQMPTLTLTQAQLTPEGEAIEVTGRFVPEEQWQAFCHWAGTKTPTLPGPMQGAQP